MSLVLVGAIAGPRPGRGEGEKLNINDVFHDHAASVARWAQRLSGPGTDVEDLVQDVFVIVQRKLPGFVGGPHLRTWLYRITANVVRSHCRRRALARFLSLSDGPEPVSTYPTPIEALERRQDIELTYRILDQLKPKYREVLILFEIEGMTGEAIAELTATKLPTVWVRLHRARQQFLDRLSRMENL